MVEGQLAVVVLAAGKSTRFRSRRSKTLHELCGKPMLEWVLDAAIPLDPAQIIIVYGEHSAELPKHYEDGYRGNELHFALQDPPAGTADALLKAQGYMADSITHMLVLPGDAPMIMTGELKRLVETVADPSCSHALLTADLGNPAGYGRIVESKEQPGLIGAIIEEADATPQQRMIRTVNGGIYIFSRMVFDDLKTAAETFGTDNENNEHYLPDVVRVSPTKAVPASSPGTILGVNDRTSLARCEAILQQGLKLHWMQRGVTFLMPETTYLDHNVAFGEDVEIGPHSIVRNGTIVGAGTRLAAGCHLDACIIGEDCELRYVHATEAKLGKRVTAGPYVNLRPGTELGDDVKIGNFVETKKAKVGSGSKLPHLQYVGDATLGENVNVGAGTIFCNYDGVNKHRIDVGSNVFIGSNSSLQAPLTIGDGAFIAMGSSVTMDVPADALAVARARQENKEGYASELRAKAQLLKDQKKQEQDSGTASGGPEANGTPPAGENSSEGAK